MDHGLDGQGLLRRRLAGAAALLLAGCGGGNTERDVDPVAPTLQISSDTPGQATGPYTVRFTFNAAVKNFTTTRILVRNGVLGSSAVTKLSDTVYTVVVTPAVNFRGLGEVQVQSDAFQDATGAVANAVAYSFGQEIDTVVIGNEPTLTIAHNATDTTATGPVTFTFTFSADVGETFTATDIQLTAGTLTSFNRTSGLVCTAVVTLPAGSTGQLVVLVDASSVQTAAGAANLQAYRKLVPFAIPA